MEGGSVGQGSVRDCIKGIVYKQSGMGGYLVLSEAFMESAT